MAITPDMAERLERARELYCVDGLDLAHIALTLELAEDDLRQARDRGEWDRTRLELAQARASIRENSIRARARLLKSVLSALDQSDPDPKELQTLAKVEETAARELKAAKGAGGPGKPGGPGRSGQLGQSGGPGKSAGTSTSLSAEAAERIRRDILGIQ